jgi:predicted  nucleic acid-binding Zn-ribbon protein
MANPEFETLLEVQDHDTEADRLRHRRDTLPERAQLAGVRASIDDVTTRLGTAGEERDAQVRREEALEEDLAAVERRMKELDSRLFSPTAAVRDMEAMSGELASLKRRRSMLEDEVLEAMAGREPLDADVTALEGEWAQLETAATALEAQIAEAEVAIDAELEAELAKRQVAAAQLADGLAQQYERLRARLDGVGAARLVGASCTGCHLTLPATELDRIKRAPADAVLTCDQCGRILVR